MAVSPEIAALDRSLALKGMDLIIRRRIGSSDSFVQVGFRGSMRGYDPREISGSIAHGDSQVICSPTAFNALWSSSAGGRQWPRRGDEILVDGRICRIEAANPITVGGKIVRIELQIRG